MNELAILRHFTPMHCTNVLLQVQGALHSYLSSAEVRNALGKFASVLHGNAECWNPNPLLETPLIVSLPPPPSSLDLELAFGRVGEVLEATIEKLKETVFGMLEELDVDCRRIEVSSILHLFFFLCACILKLFSAGVHWGERQGGGGFE